MQNVRYRLENAISLYIDGILQYGWMYIWGYVSTMYWYACNVAISTFQYCTNCRCHKTFDRALGAVSIRKTVLPGMAIPMLKIRRPNGRLIFNMEIAIRR